MQNPDTIVDTRNAINLSRLTPAGCRLQRTARPRLRACALRPRMTTPSVRAAADDHALLAALPIAAAIVGLTSKGILRLIERNSRFDEVIALTGDPAMMSGDFRNCQHLQIAQLMQAFLADFEASSELDFCEGEGIGARHYRIKLAPLSRVRKGPPALPRQPGRPDGRGPGGADAARRNAARQPDRAAQPPVVHRDDRESAASDQRP